MKFKKVLISLMLSLAMVFTALPAMAFAEPAGDVDAGAYEESTFLAQLQKTISTTKFMLSFIGAASKDELRMYSYLAVCQAEEEFTKRFGECNELFKELKDKAPEYIASHSLEISDACALLLEAAEALDNAIKSEAPKIQNYIKLAKNVSKSNIIKIKVKKLKKKSITFWPVALKKTKSIPVYDKKNLKYSAKMLSKKAKKYLKFNKKTGKITVKKGAKKGTYKIKVTIYAAANNDYKPCQLTKTIKIKVR